VASQTVRKSVDFPEAAILGCRVIIGKRGSAAFHEDVSIPEEYKFAKDSKRSLVKVE